MGILKNTSRELGRVAYGISSECIDDKRVSYGYAGRMLVDARVVIATRAGAGSARIVYVIGNKAMARNAEDSEILEKRVGRRPIGKAVTRPDRHEIAYDGVAPHRSGGVVFLPSMADRKCQRSFEHHVPKVSAANAVHGKGNASAILDDIVFNKPITLPILHNAILRPELRIGRLALGIHVVPSYRDVVAGRA